jgi:hypothetical protein
MPEDIIEMQQEPSSNTENPIYKFMKENNLTKLDEGSFLKTYSAPEKAKEIHTFMVTNKLTDLDSAKFYDTYLKKKDQIGLQSSQVSGQTSADTGLPSISQKNNLSNFTLKTKAPDKNYYGGSKYSLDEAKKAINEGLIFDKSGKLYAPSSQVLSKEISKAKDADLEQATIEKDLVEQSREMPVKVEQPKQEGSYGDYGSNIGANILGQTFIKAADIDIAAVKFLRNLSGKLPFTEKPQDIYDEKGQLTNYGKDIQSWDFMGKAIKSFKETQEKDKELLATKYKLPETTGGQIVEGLTGIIPDLAMATMTRGKNLFAGTGKLASLGNALTGAFPRQQLVMGTARGYNASDNKGAGGTFLNTLKEGVISAGQAALFELAGITGTNVGKFIGSPLKNITAKEAINLGSRLAVFTFGVPTIEKGISEGRLPNQSEILQNLGIAGAMEAFHLGMSGAGKVAKKLTPTDEAKAIKQINDVRNVAALDNFMKATPDVIDNLVKSDKSAEDLNLAALDAIKRAEDMADGEEKSKVLKTAQDLTYLANIKKITELIANSPDALSHFADDLPADVRDSFMQKAKDIHVAFNPAEQQKQSHVDTIAQAENAIKQNEALASPTNPNVKERLDAQREIEKAKATIDQATKDFNKTSDEQEQQKQALQDAKLAQQQAEPTTEEGQPVVTEEQKQQALEDKLGELKKQLQALRSEDGSIPAEKMEDFNRLRKEIAESKENAERGNSTNVTFIKKYEEGANPETSDPKILSGNAKEEAVDLIEQVIQNSKSREEAIRKIGKLGYILDIANMQQLNKYLSDRYNPEAPKVGNNKDSFQSWVEGKSDSESTEAKTEVKPASLEEEYNSKSVDELIALKKKLYPNPDIETAMTPEEKLLDKVIAKKFSEKNQEIVAKRKIAAEEVKPTEVKGEVKPVESKEEEHFNKHIELVKKNGKPLSEFKVGDKVIWASDYLDNFKQYAEGTITKAGNEYEIKRFSENPTSKTYKTFTLHDDALVIPKPEGEANYTGDESIENLTKAKVYNASDLKENPNVLKGDVNYNTVSYPKSFSTFFTNMLGLKAEGFENAKIGDVINIFNKDYVVEGFIENKNPEKTKVKLIRVDENGNLLREQDLSKKEQKQGKAKEFEEEGQVEEEGKTEITQDDLKKAEAKFAAAKDKFEKAKAKVEASQVTQRGMFGGEQKGMFAMGGEEAKNTLDPLRIATKEAKAELDDIRNKIKVQEEAQQELKPVEEYDIEKTKKIIQDVAKTDRKKVAIAASNVFEDAGYHVGELLGKADYLQPGYYGEQPFTGHYFVSNPTDVVTGGSRYGNPREFRIVDFGKYNLYKPTTEEYWNAKGSLREFAKQALSQDLTPVLREKFLNNFEKAYKDFIDDLKRTPILKKAVSEYNRPKQLEYESYRIENALEEVKNNKEFEELNKMLDEVNSKIAAEKGKDNFKEDLKKELESYNQKGWDKNKYGNKQKERFETILLKMLGYEGVDVRGLKEEKGSGSPDTFAEGSVIFDLKPGTVATLHEAYQDALKIPENKRTEKQKDLIKSVDGILNNKSKTELKPVEKKQKPFVNSQGHSVELENGKLVVKDKKGEVLSDRASKKAIEEYADNFDYSKGEKAPEVPNEITNSRDAAKYVIDESNNPEEVAQVYASEDLMPKEGNPKFQAIAEHGLGRIKTSSYKNLGDPNKIEKSMYLKIFSQEKGLPIDVVAKSISDKYEGLNIEPKDIVDYIEKYSRGDKGALEYEDTDVAKQAKDKFNKLTGLDLTPELANKVLDKQLEKANQEQLDIIKEDYETAKQLEDAYWAEYEKTDGFTKESPVSETNEPKTTKKETVTKSELEEPEGTMITHAANKETRKQLGLEQPELISNLTDEERYVKAQEMIKKGYDINKLIDKMYNPEEVLNPLENAITSLYKQALNAEAKKNPSDENLALGKRLLDARDQANSRSGAALQSLKGEAPKDTLLDFYVNKMEDNSVDVLTDKQKEEVRADYEAIKTKMDIVEAKNKELEKLNVELLAQKAIDEQKAEKKKAPTTGKRDYAAERKDVIDSIKEKLRKARTGQGGLTSVPVPYAKELIEIAPDVTKLAKLYIEEGVEKLEDIVSKVHASLKDDIDGLKKEDIQDVLAGKYGKPSKAKSEIERKLIDLKTEAKLISQIEDARQLKPRTEKERVEQNKTLTDLRKELNKVRRETGYYDESMLKSLIEKNKRETQDLQDKIQKGDFKEEEKPVSRIENPELKKKYPELYNEWLDAKDAKDEQQHKYDLKRVEEQINALSTRKRFVAKAKIFGEEGLNTVKALKAGVDNSAVFVQSAIAVLNPMNYKATFRALVAQTQDFFSETRARRRVVEVHENKKLWALIEKSGLDYLDPKGYNKAMRDEQFGGRNWLERKIKIGNKEIQIAKYTTAPFERLFTSFSNEFRLQLFLRGAAELAKQGKTTESDLKYYQDLASYVNNVTGRGKLKEGKIRQAEPIISTVLWAPKLLSSTLNVLGIGDLANLGKNKGYYRNMTPQMRKYAIGQTAAGLGMGITLMAAYSLLPNKEVDSDPTSVTFGQVKDTETGWSYAIFGRYTPIVRYLAMMTMLTKNVGEGKAKPVEPLKETYKFIRGKMQPTTGIVSDIIMRKDFSGKPYKLSNVPSDLFEPLFIKDLRQQLAIDGTSSLLTKGIPAFYGLKVSNDKMYDKRDLKSLLETVDSSTIDKNTLFNYNENRPINKQEYKEFVSKRDELLKDYYKNITENGVPFINADGRAERLPVDSKKLDKESFMKAVNKLKGLATIIAKEELFGTKELTDEEREAKEELKYLWLDQNIGKQEEEDN